MAGVGGVTIEQAQGALSDDEVHVWQAYSKKYGQLDQGLRFEILLAHIQSLMATHWQMKVNGGKPTPKDFMHTVPVQVEETPEFATIDQVAAMLKNVSKGRRK